MVDRLERYYERELLFLDDTVADFAKQFPAEAGRLPPDPNVVRDPHATRMIESLALLAGRLHYNLDQNLPELIESLSGFLYPHFLAPAPSLTMAQFEIDLNNPPPPEGIHFPRHARLSTGLLGKPPLPCRWQAAYPVSLWPIRLIEAKLRPGPLPANPPPPPRTQGALTLRFECLGGHTFSQLALDSLPLFLSGENQLIASLYEVLFNQALQVVFRSPGVPAVTLDPAECLEQVGLGRDEGLLPWPIESFIGYRLLTELLVFREKFLFAKLGGWSRLRGAGFGKQVDVTIFLGRTQQNLEQGVNARTFLLGCTPIANVFAKSAEPIALTHKKFEYRVVPTRRCPMGMEVQTVESVRACNPGGAVLQEYQPFYALTQGQTRSTHRAFWYARRKHSLIAHDKGSEVYLTPVDLDLDVRQPADAVLDVRVTCSNRDWPRRFQRAGQELTLESDFDRVPGRIHCLHAPTLPLRPPLKHAAIWRLQSQNSLNQVPLSDPEAGRLALQETMRLCDLASLDDDAQRAAVARQMIEGVSGLRSRPVLGRVRSRSAVGVCRGLEFTLELDETKYVGTGVFLIASVINQYLGLAAGMNAFSQLVARTKQGEGPFKKWPPRAADKMVI